MAEEGGGLSVAARRRKKLNRGRWAVQRERCRISDPFPPPADHLSPLGDVLGSLIEKHGLAERTWEAEMEQDWAEIAGPGVAAHTRPGRLHEGRIVVFVDSSVWLSELSRYGKGQLLANLKQRFGTRIRDLRLELDPGRDP